MKRTILLITLINLFVMVTPSEAMHRDNFAAARLGDQINPKKESSGSQFYIVVGKTWSLKELEHLEQTGYHPKFTVVKCDRSNRPIKDVKILSVTKL